jgi:hypothetical protein
MPREAFQVLFRDGPADGQARMLTVPPKTLGWPCADGMARYRVEVVAGAPNITYVYEGTTPRTRKR